MAPIMYIKEMRMRKAAELIKENQYTMSEIAYMVGFSDPHYFSKSFKSYWGMTSTEYAKKSGWTMKINDGKVIFYHYIG